MNAYLMVIPIVLIVSIGSTTVHSLWIPIPRNTNRIPQLVRTVNVPRLSQASAPAFPAAMKRSSDGSSQESSVTAVAYEVDNHRSDEIQPTIKQLGQHDGHDESAPPPVDIESHWPITPRACLVLMKILQAQTAEIIDQGNTDMDFYEAASYYQPAIRTLYKCMDMADRTYDNVMN